MKWLVFTVSCLITITAQSGNIYLINEMDTSIEIIARIKLRASSETFRWITLGPKEREALFVLPEQQLVNLKCAHKKMAEQTDMDKITAFANNQLQKLPPESSVDIVFTNEEIFVRLTDAC